MLRGRHTAPPKNKRTEFSLAVPPEQGDSREEEVIFEVRDYLF